MNCKCSSCTPVSTSPLILPLLTFGAVANTAVCKCGKVFILEPEEQLTWVQTDNKTYLNQFANDTGVPAAEREAFISYWKGVLERNAAA
jgi:hypothetical protein